MRNNPKFKLAVSLIPVVALALMLWFIIAEYGGDAISGGSQVVLLLSAGICIALSIWLFKTPWKAFEDEMANSIGELAMAILILLLIGALSGSWTVSGIVPAFICYGVQLISPKIFLITTCIICCIVSLATGSSWTTIATIGVALLGIGKAEGFSDPVIAGAIISGSYFGDKISPLSDTTVIAASCNKVPMFEHIRYMLITTIPALVITLVIFLIMGFSHSEGDSSSIMQYTYSLRDTFHISPWLMTVPVLTAWMIIKKAPAFIVLGVSALAGAVLAIIAQPDIVHQIGKEVSGEGAGVKTQLIGAVEMLYNNTNIDSGNDAVNSLIATRGMKGMLSTIFLVICSLCFGSCMKAGGMLYNLTALVVPFTRKRTGLVASTICTGTVMTAIAADQYLSILLTSNLFRDIYKKEGYEGKLLSRSVEDSSTVVSPLIPWSSCGMTQSTILGVPTLTYLPWCFFNILSPIMGIVIAATGYKIFRHKDSEAEKGSAEVEAK